MNTRIVFIPAIQKFAITQNNIYLGFFMCHSDAIESLLSIRG